jgi:hypothetical protein
MNEEYRSLMANDTWNLIPIMNGRKLIIYKWVYKTKYSSNGSVERLEARLIAKGFSQVEGIDYNETFSPIKTMNLIFLVLVIVTSHKSEVHHMDVTFDFLHGYLQEEIYMEQPIDYVQNHSSHIFHLDKSLYGFKQAPWSWYAKITNFHLNIDFSRCHYGPNAYTKKVGNHLIILVFYVDDLILIGNHPKILNHMKSTLKKKF